jgi:hypothetical protein
VSFYENTCKWILNFCDNRDGTTDVTRTVHLGTPTDFERECYTRVFKGTYAIRSCIFPAKIKVCYQILLKKNLTLCVHRETILMLWPENLCGILASTTCTEQVMESALT